MDVEYCSDEWQAASVAAGTFTAAQATLVCARPEAATVGGSLDVMFLLFSAYLVFLMQAGFAMLCAGSVRSKNTMNILLKNCIDALGGAVAFTVLGYGFAHGAGDNPNGFIGNNDFFLAATDDPTAELGGSWAAFLFQWAFAAAAATIVSGSVAERTSFIAYLVYSVFLTAFVYPVVVHWVWSGDGWLTAFTDDAILDTGMIDFAGSGVVHMVGGFAGLMGAAIVGPRVGRFDAVGKPVDMPGHSATLVVLGTFLLWFGWYGFNPGSQLAISGEVDAAIASRAAVTTTLAAAAAGLTSLFVTKALEGTWNLLAVCNGLLAGLVSITAGCPVVTPWAALVIGAIGGVVFIAGEKLLLKLKIDDPLSAAPMHGFCGVWGVLAVGFFARERYVRQEYSETTDFGVFYGGEGKLLACQLIGIICIIAWVCVLLGALFMGLKVAGLLRVSQEEELAGLDVSKHGGSAYYMEPGAGGAKPAPTVSVVRDDLKAAHPTI